MRHYLRRFYGVLGLTALFASASPAANAQVSVLTRSYNTQRTGSNSAETALNTSNVAPATFGKLFARATDGNVYAQPLYVSNLAIGGKTRNVLFIETMHDTVYAYDADDPAATAPLWKTSYTATKDGVNPPAVTTTTIPTADFFSSYKDIANEMGILSTPVIDPATNTMYVLVRTKETGGASGTYVQRLHALDITTGLDNKPAVVISAIVNGTGNGSKNGKITFDPKLQNQRTGLLLDHGAIYLAWASQGDNGNYHGWVMSYDAGTLAQKGVWCSTPNGGQGGIWQSGQGLTADAAGNIYCVVGNGDSSAGTGGTKTLGYSNSIVKLTPGASSLTVADWFMPYNTTYLNGADLDTECGVVLMPGINGTTNAIFGSKGGYFYMVNTANMGHYNPKNTGSPQNDNQIVQSFSVSDQHIHGSPALWYGPTGVSAFVWAENSWLRGYNFSSDTGTFLSTPASQSAYKDPNGMPGGFITTSSNGTQAGTGIVWINLPYSGDANQAVVPGVLRAFDASDLTHELWNSRSNAANDDFGNFAKFCPPTVANGKVYMASFSNQVMVYGLLSAPAVPTVTALASGATVSVRWNTVPAANTYTVRRAASASGPYTTLTTSATTTTYNDTGLATNATYYYTVAAVNGAGSSADSVPVSVTTLPATPTALAAYTGDSNIALVWNPVPGEVTYSLLRAKGNGGSYLPLASGLTSANYADLEVNNGTLYTYIVNAVGSAGSSPYSASASATPAPILFGQTVTVAGQVALEQCADPAQNITLEFRPTDGTGAITQTATLDSYGRFSISGMAAKSYNLAIKGAIWLRHITPVDASQGSITSFTASLLAGDSNNDNSVDSTDFGTLIGAFNSSAAVPASGYAPTADFNCDGLVDSADFGLLIGNFGAQGDN